MIRSIFYDRFMGQNLKNEMERKGIKKDIRFFSGSCYVHEEYDIGQILKVRLEHPGAKIVSHPECNSTVVDNSDFVGSTGGCWVIQGNQGYGS